MTHTTTITRTLTIFSASLLIASCAAAGSSGGAYRSTSGPYRRVAASRPPSSEPRRIVSPAGLRPPGAASAASERARPPIAPYAASDEDSAGAARSAPPSPPVRGVAKRSAAPAVTGAASETPLSLRPPPPPVQMRPARIRLLTAASVSDHDRFANYLSYLARHGAERAATGLAMDRRVRLRVVDATGAPINDAAITVTTRSQRTLHGRTHADGRWDFFPSFSAPQATGMVAITVTAGPRRATLHINLPTRGTTTEALVRLAGTQALRPTTLDLAFAIDVTGSMGDELRYVNREVADIVQRIRASVPNTRVRVAAVFYKDRMDTQRLQMLPFTTDVAGFGRAMTRIHAGGGGDYPEDMNAGLDLALRRLRWSQGNAARVLVLLADAPPKRYADATYRYPQAMADASRRGIRILPVAASGADRLVEYIFRAMGALTSTPYVYLTDDSGIGGRHLEADTDRVGVEKFNDLLTRLIVSDLQGKGMHEPGALGPQ